MKVSFFTRLKNSNKRKSIFLKCDAFARLTTFLNILLIIAAHSGVKCSNRTEQPLLLLISFDGFRWDYLTTYNLSNFEYLKSIGSYADYIYNSFSTVTFPNHWTIVTGLYEESHGIIHNYMYDPMLKKNFTPGLETEKEEWYRQNKFAEPIWITNQKAGKGRVSAVEWIGSNVPFDKHQIISIKYNRTKSYNKLIDQFIELFTQENNSINFGALYFDEPDNTGHKYGPFSNEIKEKLIYLNEILGYLIDQLKSNHLFGKMNIIITSDHGMEKISNETVVYLDEFTNTSLYNSYGSSVVKMLFLKNQSHLDDVYKALKYSKHIDAYKKTEIPEQLHFKNNVRVGDIMIVAHLGYTIFFKNDSIDWKVFRGNHGYYNNFSSMYPLFIAQGPAFNQNYKIESFNNVDIYPLMCLLLDVKPAVNNGSIENVLRMLTLRYNKKLIRKF
jgi:ectonucleotide pyrophosphatase/phosphodiesterase family member 5